MSQERSFFSKSAKAFAVLSMSAFLSACGGSGGGGGEGHAIPKTDFTACDQHPEVGSSALIGNASKTEFVKSEFFNKPYDRYDLEAVLDASVKSTSQYVNSLGITLRKVVTGSPGGKCPNYFGVPNVSDNLLAIWNEAASGTSNDASLQGLFFEFCGRDGSGASCKEREMTNPTILVNHVADRWTLVHELMHYNFNQGRKSSPEIPSARRLEQMVKYHEARFKKFYQDFKDMPNRGDLANAITELETMVLANHHSLAQGPLEEVAIEATLIKLWSQDQLKNVGGRTPSTWYLKQNAEKASVLDQFEQVVLTLKKDAEANFWPEIAEQADKALVKILAPKTEAMRFAEEAEAQIEKKSGALPPVASTGFQAFVLDPELHEIETAHHGCGREHNTQQLEASAKAIRELVLSAVN